MPASDFPLTLTIDYPEEPNRLTTFFRMFVAIPIWIIATQLGSLLWLPVVIMIVFRRKYPRWWFDWNLALTRFSTRVGAYSLLIAHEYPSTDEEQYVHLDFEYPDVENDLNRWLPLVKWFLVIPHIIVLIILWIVALPLAIALWFAILFTGQVPRGLFNYMVGVLRYGNRMWVYGFLLTTDRYPPFSLSE
ncbi:MAG: DUF4389 domain-containing protein [Dehalococcoidia bacterium]|jgi:hypothetical protein|nr:DUF4389 domain-containing protein [Dehalococcoidia bacterium]